MQICDAIVFVVDDDPDVRSALSRALENRGFIVESYPCANSFLSAVDWDHAGCLILDYGMPKMNGLELQNHLTNSGHDIPTIFITGHGGVPEAVTAIKGGAVEFLEKPFRQDTLIEHVNLALKAGERNQRTDEISVRQRFSRLTDREKEIAGFLTAKTIRPSSKIIGRQLDISPRTVDHHRARILEKMAVRSVVDLRNVMASCQDITN